MFGKSRTTAEAARPPGTLNAAAPVPATVARSPTLVALPEPVIKPSIISDAVEFVGELRTRGALHIDGMARGIIEAESVTVGTTGSLDGTVRCGRLHVKGSFSGSVTCDDLIITDTARLSGSMSYKSIVIQRGARVTGEFVVRGAD